MPRNEEEVLENLKVEFESANAATSASVGLTAMTSVADEARRKELAGNSDPDNGESGMLHSLQ
ncbi:hypothetical protein D3C81_1625530 [compost metagenome]|uniref:Uncharacterized protein n=1 Tax=Paenibacillus mesotrionivorans TaxID=3160968 RepID=A0ACC7P7B7_9BACL